MATGSNPKNHVRQLERDLAELRREQRVHVPDEGYLRLLMQQIPGVLWTTGPDLRITSVHGAALGRLGLDGASALGQTIGEFLQVSAPGFQLLSGSRQAIEDRQESFVLNWRGRTLQVLIEPLRDTTGKISGTLGVALEIPDTHALQDALLVSQARIAGIVNISEDAIISLDNAQRVTLFNFGAEKMFGYAAAEVLGKPLDLLMPERYTKSHQEHVSGFGRSPDSLRAMNERGAIFGRRRDGSEFPAEASISKFEVAGETILNVRMRDITERERSEEQLKARARQQAALARLGQLALRGGQMAKVMEDACESVAKTLAVDLCTVYELPRGGESLTLVACAGGQEDLAGCRTLPLGNASQAGYTLATGLPMAVTDLGAETRFRDACLQAQGIGSGITVIIDSGDGPFGVLGAHSRQKRDFAEPDLDFLQTVANILATAIGRKRAEDALHQTNETLHVVNRAAPVSIWMLDLEGNVTFWNPAAERTFGWTEAEVLHKPPPMILEEDREEFAALLVRLRAGEKLSGMEARRQCRDGSVLAVSLWTAPLRDSMGMLQGTLVVGVDVTERKRLEEQLRQSQKLESIGLLAGGVAHDFNNLLTGIMGNISLAIDMLPPSNSATGMLESALGASERAAELIRQLLAYSGKGRFVVQRVDLSAAVRELIPLLQTSVPKKVDLELDLDPGLPPVASDPGQVQQLIMNLTINGAEAIGEAAGTVRLRTRPVEFAEAQDCGDQQLLAPGAYVQLDVTDNGCGMDETIRARIFEPFFTTKFTGRGLGLAAVAGIVRAHKGAIRVTSSPGKGSTFTILLPADAAGAARQEKQKAKGAGSAPASIGTVLIVDDEDVVRSMAKAALERYGYDVVLATDGSQAVQIFRQCARQVVLVLLDLSMPVMGGEEALHHLLEIQPAVRVVVSSGYSEAEAVRRFTNTGVAGFIQKPYTAAQLGEKVKTVLSATG